MSDFYKKVCVIVRQRNGIVGPLQLWQVVNDKIVRWHSTLGQQPTPEEVNQIKLEAEMITAEEHLRSVGLAGDRQPTLLYLRQSLIAAGKTCAELNAVEAYLQQILAMFAANPTPRNDWPNPSVTFEAAVQSAMNALNS